MSIKRKSNSKWEKLIKLINQKEIGDWLEKKELTFITSKKGAYDAYILMFRALGFLLKIDKNTFEVLKHIPEDYSVNEVFEAYKQILKTKKDANTTSH